MNTALTYFAIQPVWESGPAVYFEEVTFGLGVDSGLQSIVNHLAEVSFEFDLDDQLVASKVTDAALTLGISGDTSATATKALNVSVDFVLGGSASHSMVLVNGKPAILVNGIIYVQ